MGRQGRETLQSLLLRVATPLTPWHKRLPAPAHRYESDLWIAWIGRVDQHGGAHGLPNYSYRSYYVYSRRAEQRALSISLLTVAVAEPRGPSIRLIDGMGSI